MPATEAALAALIFAIGACVQGAVGFGSNLIAAPLLVLVSDRFVPGPVIVASALLNVLIAHHSRRGSTDRTLRAAMGGQVLGALVAGAVLSALPDDALSVVFAALVLVAVGLSLQGRRMARRRRNLAAAGLASGFMGTISGIGGPPIALAYQGLDGPVLRATLARFFLLGNLVSIPTLIAVGRLGPDDLLSCAVLLPGALVGFAGSRWLAGHLDRTTARPVVLALSTAAAVAVIVKTVW